MVTHHWWNKDKGMEQIIAQVVMSLILIFIGRLCGQNIMVATGFGMVIGLLTLIYGKK